MSQRDKKRSLAERLEAWLKGDLRLREESELYQAAREDPFLQEALQGYNRFPEGNHTDTIAGLKGKLKKQKRRGLILPIRIAAAAASILILTASVWWILQPAQGELASAESIEKTEEQPPEIEEPIEPIVADEELTREEEAVEQETFKQKETLAKPQTQQTEPTTPEIAELQKEEAEAEIAAEMAMDVTVAPPSIPPAEDISPPPAPVREEKVAAGQTAAKKKSDQSNLTLRESTQYSPIAQSRRLQAPSAYNLPEEDQRVQAARPVGGFTALDNYLDSAWQQTSSADSMLVEKNFIGLEFEVLEDGSLSGFVILNSIGPREDSTFIQVLKSGPRWESVNPEVKRPIKVQYRYPQKND